MSEMVKRVARVLCQESGYPPERLEPGNTPYGDEREVIDGWNAQTREPGFFMWRQYEERARRLLREMRRPTDEMVKRGADFASSELWAKEAWEEMIDEALR